MINLGRFHDLDRAIREGIRIVLEENTTLLVRNDRSWIHRLSRMGEVFKDVAHAKADTAGTGNVRFLNGMYQSMAKVET